MNTRLTSDIRVLSTLPQSLGQFHWIRLQLRRGTTLAHFHQPDVAILKVLQEFAVLGVIHLPRPHYLCAVDVRLVVHPVLIQLMAGAVSHDHEVTSLSLL